MTAVIEGAQHGATPELWQQLEELPDLVARGKISVDDVSLSELSERLLQLVTESSTVDLQITGDLLLAVARLMVFKSTHLLAQPVAADEEGPPRMSRDGALARAEMGARIGWLRAREGYEAFPSAPIQHSIKRAVAPRSPSGLPRVWSEMRGRQLEEVRNVPVPGYIRLEVAVSRLLRGLRSRRRLSLARIVARASKTEAVMYFLGVLELHRRRQISASQENLFADIQLESREAASHEDVRAG